MSKSNNENQETASVDEPQIVDREEVPIEKPVATEPKTESEETDRKEESEAEESSDEEEDCETVAIVPDSEMYAISVDGEPRYYVRTPEEANLCMWHLARRLVYLTPDYTTRYVKVGKNELHIEHQCNWYVISYPETIHRLKYRKIRGIRVQTLEKEKEE